MEAATEAFTRLFQRHYGDVERFVRRRAPDVDAADIVAEVFLVAWRRWKDVPRHHPLPWLYLVARNVLANEVRGLGRTRRLRDRIASEPGPEAEVDHADVVVSRLDVAAAFDRLPEADQEILRLVAWEGLSTRDVAAALGATVPATGMRIIRARRRLRAEIRQVGESTESISAPIGKGTLR